VTFLRKDCQPAAGALTILESRQGYQQLEQALLRLKKKYDDVHFHVRIDAAGQYARNLEQFLRGLDLPMTLSIGEPKRNKDYRQAHFPKRKADAIESHAMARFAVVERPDATLEVPQEFYALQEVANRLQTQATNATRAVNRLHNLLARVFPELATLTNDFSATWVAKLLQKYPTPEKLTRAKLDSLIKIPYLTEVMARKIQSAAKQTVGTLRGEVAESLVRELAGQLQRCQAAKKNLENLLLSAFRALPHGSHMLIESIPGIGEVTAAILVAKIVSIGRFETPKSLVGYFGVFPEEDTSGVDKFGKPIPPGTMRMSSKGNDLVRAYLWNAARVAIQYNPAVRALYKRLRGRGVRGDVALGHCMRKLLHLVFAIWKTGKPFDENHYPWEPTDQSEVTTEDERKEETAGHKRDVLPLRKVVTAAMSSVEAEQPAINKNPQTHSAGKSVDYAYIREQIGLEQVLRHLGHYEQLRGSGAQRRGPCPLHGSNRSQSRSFAVNLQKNVFHCFHPTCEAQGNTLDFWATVQGLTIHEAALNLAETFHLQLNRNREDGTRNLKQKPG
jgi:transposase